MKKYMLNNFTIPNSGKKIYEFANKIFPINRSITGNGNRQTLKIIKKILPDLKIREIPSLTKVADWQIPLEWNVKEAYIIDPKGKKILDFKKNNLHLVGYSIPIKKKINLDELKKHLHFKKSLPNAIPYVVSYYKSNWGFCLSYNQFKKLKQGKYEVFIDSKFSKGSLTYGELLIAGSTKDEILLSTYICHPSLANNEVSGPALLTFISSFLNSLKNRRYSYRIVFHPENIGAIAYICKNLINLKKYVKAGYVLSCVGDNKNFSFIPSRHGDTLSDKAARYILKNFTKKYKEYSFLDSGSDERRYCSPNVDLPVASILRTKYGNYKEYHTSLDNMKLISKEGFQGAFNIYLNVIKLLENNYKFHTKTVCEPQLGKRGLYPNISKWPNEQSWMNVRKLINCLSFADGKKDLIELSNSIEVKSDELLIIIDKLLKEDLISIK